MKRLSFATLKSGKCTQLLLASVLSLVSIHVSANSGYVNVPDYTAYMNTPSGFTPLYRSGPGIGAYKPWYGKKRVRVLAHQSAYAKVYFDNRVQGWVPNNRLEKLLSTNSGYINVPDYTAYMYTPNGFTPLTQTPSGRAPYTQLRGKKRVRVLAHQSLWAQVYFDNRVQGWVPKNRLTR